MTVDNREYSVEETFLEAARALSSARPEHMYADLVGAVATLLKADIAILGRYVDNADAPAIDTLAWIYHGRLLPNDTYLLAGTPCETVIGHEFQFYPENVGYMFPESDAKESKVEGYAAYPIYDNHNAPLGILTVMTHKPMRQPRLTESLLRIFAERIGSEILRADGEEALRGNESYYRTLFDNAMDGLSLNDKNGIVLDINPALAELIGYSREELIGQIPPAYRSPEKQAEFQALIDRVLSGENVISEFELLRKDGSRRTAEARSIAIYHQGKPRVLRVVRDIADQKQREQELVQSESRYRGIFNASIDGLVLMDENGIVVDANPAIHGIDGWDREDIIGKLPPTFRAPDRQERYRQFIKRIIDGGEVTVELDLLCKDGSYRTADTRSRTIEYHGKPHILTIIRDIHEQKQRDTELVESEARYRAIFDASVDGLVLLDNSGLVVDVNPAILVIDGFTRDELIGDFPPGFRSEELRQVHIEYVARVLGGETIRHETKLPRKDGTEYIAELSATSLDFRGQPHVLVVVRDITDRREREAALSQSQDRLRATVESALDGIISINEEGEILDFNPAAEANFGHRAADVIGTPLIDAIIPERFRARHEKGLRRYLKTGFGNMIGKRVEVTGQRANGSEFPAELSIGVSEGADGKVFTGFLRDITDRKRASDERSMLEAQLRQAQKMEAIGHLTGGVAHDFNNILTGVLGYVEMARDHLDPAVDKKLVRYLERAQRSGEKARDLIQQMLTFSRGDPGKPRPLALVPVIAEGVTLLESTVPSSVEITTNFPKSLATVTLDPVHVEQVLVNLCINARDAMDGVGRLHIALREMSHTDHVCTSCRQNISGQFIELVVSDSGPGIGQQLLDRIFEPFFSTKETGKGSGMGLATVHGIVHEHGGHIIVDSTINGGTSMRVLFPAEKARLSEPAGLVERASGKQDESKLAGEVLVVDDNPAVAEFLQDLLDSWGLAVTTFHDGQEAIKHCIARPNSYDLVVSDQTMPHITGLQFAETLLREEPDLPIVLYTGYSEELNEEILEKSGVRALIKKPLDIPQFRATVECLLSERPQV